VKDVDRAGEKGDRERQAEALPHDVQKALREAQSASTEVFGIRKLSFAAIVRSGVNQKILIVGVDLGQCTDE
jgi:hypothetical protein